MIPETTADKERQLLVLGRMARPDGRRVILTVDSKE